MSAALESPALDGARPNANLDPDIDRIVEQSRSWCARPVGLRDRLPGLLIGGSFLAFALGLLVWLPVERAPGLYVYALFITAYAAASRVEFQVGPGLALPTQIVFVPM